MWQQGGALMHRALWIKDMACGSACAPVSFTSRLCTGPLALFAERAVQQQPLPLAMCVLFIGVDGPQPTPVSRSQ